MTTGEPLQRAGSRPHQIDDAETVVLAGEAVVHHRVTHALHRLEATTAAVWLWCDGEATAAEIAAELTPAFGGDASAANVAVAAALAQLAAHGLLRGTAEPELLHLVAGEEALAADGSRIVLPATGYLSEDGDDGPSRQLDAEFPCRMIVRLGERHDRLVIIATDSLHPLDQLRRLLHDWLDDSCAKELSATPATFHVRLGAGSDGRGRTAIPSLRHGSVTIAQARTAAPVVHALCSLLAGIHELGTDSLPHVGLRAFTFDDRLLFVDAPPPMLLADRTLLEAGVSELVNWQLTLLPDGRVRTAPPLPGLRWLAAGIDEPASGRADWEVVGMASITEQPLTPGALLTELARHCSDAAWFTLVARAVTTGGAHDVQNIPALRACVLAGLTES